MDEPARPPRLTIGVGALAGGAAGALVGFADGLRAALLVGTGVRTTLATAVSASGGADGQGSLRGVILFHQGAATLHKPTRSHQLRNCH